MVIGTSLLKELVNGVSNGDLDANQDPNQIPKPNKIHLHLHFPLARTPTRHRANSLRSKPDLSLHFSPSKPSLRQPNLQRKLAQQPNPKHYRAFNPHGLPPPNTILPHPIPGPRPNPGRQLSPQHLRRLDDVAAMARDEAALRVLDTVARQEREAQQARCEPLQSLLES